MKWKPWWASRGGGPAADQAASEAGPSAGGDPADADGQPDPGGRGWRRHLVTLERERKNLDQAVQFCQALKDREVRLDSLDAGGLLREMEQMEQARKQSTKAVRQQKEPVSYHGKQSMEKLMKQNCQLTNIEVTDGNIKSFENNARKYHIDSV